MKTFFSEPNPYSCALSRLKEIAFQFGLRQDGMVYQTTLSLLSEQLKHTSKRRLRGVLSGEQKLASFLEIVNNIIPIVQGDYYADALP